MRNPFRRNHVAELVIEIRCADSDRRAEVPARHDLQEQVRKGGRHKPHSVAVGERFDTLVATKKMLRHPVRGIQWLCSCDCGGQAYRYASDLNQAARLRRPQRCAKCLEAARRDKRAAWQDMVGEAYRRQYVDYRTLWTEAQTLRLMNEIQIDLEAEYGDVEEELPRLPLYVTSDWKNRRVPKLTPSEQARKDDEEENWRNTPMTITPEMYSALVSLADSQGEIA